MKCDASIIIYSMHKCSSKSEGSQTNETNWCGALLNSRWNREELIQIETHSNERPNSLHYNKKTQWKNACKIHFELNFEFAKEVIIFTVVQKHYEVVVINSLIVPLWHLIFRNIRSLLPAFNVYRSIIISNIEKNIAINSTVLHILLKNGASHNHYGSVFHRSDAGWQFCSDSGNNIMFKFKNEKKMWKQSVICTEFSWWFLDTLGQVGLILPWWSCSSRKWLRCHHGDIDVDRPSLLPKISSRLKYMNPVNETSVKSHQYEFLFRCMSTYQLSNPNGRNKRISQIC